MNKIELTEIKVIELNLNEVEISEKISKIMEELRKKGYQDVKVTIEGSIEDRIKKAGFNVKLFEQIKTKQDLPDWVVYDLIESSGKLNGTDFYRRIKNGD